MFESLVGFVGRELGMSFKMKMEWIERDGKGLNWFLREVKYLEGLGLSSK